MTKVNGIHWQIRNEEQRGNLFEFLRNMPLPFQCKAGKPVHPKTAQQIRYAHSLCESLAQHHRVSLDVAKRDAKAEYGVVQVHMSIVTGEKTARLLSFSEYSREQMTGFLTAMEAHMSEKGIAFVASDAE